jgi:hypothetical protein
VLLKKFLKKLKKKLSRQKVQKGKLKKAKVLLASDLELLLPALRKSLTTLLMLILTLLQMYL